YFPRSGVLDRRFNPKSGFHLIQSMHQLFNRYGKARSLDTTRSANGVAHLIASTESAQLALILDDNSELVAQASCHSQWLNWRAASPKKTLSKSPNDYPAVLIDTL
ncbi:MAG: hypothetical protein KTR32_33305, partial [Granulosicoccus sp.]|nr:hypothetical protein [Granulosicoccus sp.]